MRNTLSNLCPNLSDEQIDAVNKIIRKEITILMGSAGTGKSAVIAAVSQRLGKQCLVVTPTHKTQLALEEKGVINVNQVTGLINNIHVQNKLVTDRVTHIIVDESGMISRKSKVLIANWIGNNSKIGEAIHIVYVGDPLQLEPVAEGARFLESDWFSEVSPDFVLTKGFRQSAKINLEIVDDTEIDAASTIICMTNATRNQINLVAHISKHGKDAYTSRFKAVLKIHAGDKLITYVTDSNQTYRNNLVYKVRKVVDFNSPEKGECFKVWFEGIRTFTLIKKSLFRVKNYTNPDTDEKREWEFAYAITCHAAQGSGFDKVTVYLERHFIDGKYVCAIPNINIQKWLYTAITRGIHAVTVVDPTRAIKELGLSTDMSIRTSFTPANNN